MSAPRVEHDAAAGRFVVRLPGGEGFVAYEERDGGTLDLQHTVVPEAERGRGVGEALVKGVLDWARAHDRRIVPSCPFVAAYLQDHPEAQDLVARG